MADVSIIIGRRIRCQTEFHRQMAVVLSNLDIRQGAHLLDTKVWIPGSREKVFIFPN